MKLIQAIIKRIPATKVYAHCDLPCGVYDPAQARIEAQSVLNIMKKMSESDDDNFQDRCLIIKEKRAELVKKHLWVLWTDYFKPEHIEKFPTLHDLVWRATKAAGDAKRSVDPTDGQNLIDLIDEIGKVFEQTKEGYKYQPIADNLKIQEV
ncbi:superoxide dismutase, Ni [Candidatus Microgenomates bacterium]|nr:superoxide dismutase, Ni [Candidatus Microgenomates bacterium]